MNVLLVGHRGAGKSTLGPLVAAQLGRQFVDLDAVIEDATGTSCAELVASDEAAFRHLERETLTTVLAEPSRVVAAGAGLEAFGDALVVWVEREGWEETALNERPRLRPELSWSDEHIWMLALREPRWRRGAHLRYEVPRGRSAQAAAEDIATLVRWCAPSGSSIRDAMWIVCQDAADLGRAAADVKRFGFAGVEIRSDRVRDVPRLDVPMLAALRSNSAAWLRECAHADAFDVDRQFLDTAERSELFALPPRPLILSTHPSRFNPDDVGALARAARWIEERHPQWLEHLTLKYAPHLDSPDEIGMGRALVKPLRRAGIPVTFLPQGWKWAWVRPLLARENATHYVAARLAQASMIGQPPALTSMTLQDWLPHIAGEAPETYDALIGGSVEHSRGDVWHRAAALQAGEPVGYAKVWVKKDNVDATLAAFDHLGVRGVSVTSPLKRRIAFVCPDDATFGQLLAPEEAARAASRGMPVRNGNTLVRTDDGWLATDTDEIGMAACLAHFEAAGFGPGTVALYGRGGVTPAILRAIEASDWFVVLHASAREGWPEQRPGFVTLVINASGSGGDAATNGPRCDVWLDLHYHKVEPVEGARLHVNGDMFFEAQARAQRAFWSSRAGR